VAAISWFHLLLVIDVRSLLMWGWKSHCMSSRSCGWTLTISCRYPRHSRSPGDSSTHSPRTSSRRHCSSAPRLNYWQSDDDLSGGCCPLVTFLKAGGCRDWTSYLGTAAASSIPPHCWCGDSGCASCSALSSLFSRRSKPNGGAGAADYCNALYLSAVASLM
jgi:hypothetical protein